MQVIWAGDKLEITWVKKKVGNGGGKTRSGLQGKRENNMKQG